MSDINEIYDVYSDYCGSCEPPRSIDEIRTAFRASGLSYDSYGVAKKFVSRLTEEWFWGDNNAPMFTDECEHGVPWSEACRAGDCSREAADA